MTCDTIGGVWTYAVELSRALSRAHVAVTLATMGRRLSAEQWAQVEVLPRLEVCESEYKLEWMPDCWRDVESSRGWLADLAARVRPDVLHLNTYAHAAIPLCVPRVVVAHSCVYSWWQAVHGCAPGDGWSRYHREVAGGLAAADLVVAPTRAVLRALAVHYATHTAARVVPNARDGSGLERGSKQAFVFAAGRVWDRAKNIALLDRVAPQLPWPVLVAGDARAPHGETFAAAHLHLLGHLPAREMRTRLAAASIYALPARYEPFGLSVLEAALSGCALVLGDVPSLRESWEGAAEFVAPDDEAGWRETLRALIASPRARADLADRACRRAARFTPDTMLAGYLDAYAAARQRAATRERAEAGAFDGDARQVQSRARAHGGRRRARAPSAATLDAAADRRRSWRSNAAPGTRPSHQR